MLYCFLYNCCLHQGRSCVQRVFPELSTARQKAVTQFNLYATCLLPFSSMGQFMTLWSQMSAIHRLGALECESVKIQNVSCSPPPLVTNSLMTLIRDSHYFHLSSKHMVELYFLVPCYWRYHMTSSGQWGMSKSNHVTSSGQWSINESVTFQAI